MTWLVLLKLAAAVVSVALGAGILARDHELRANRLIAVFLFCNAWWASVEFFLYAGVEPDSALLLYRVMCLGWMPMGVLCMHASLTLSAMEDHPIARSARFVYAAIALLLPFAMTTGFVIAEAEATSLGWRPQFGPGFPIAYFLLAAPVVAILACWRGVMTLPGSGGQLALARIVFFGLSTALVAGTCTAVIMPLLEIPVVGITTTLVALAGIAAAFTLRRYGHSLISPQAFAREILDTLEDGVVLLGEDGVLRDANRAFLRLVGARELEAIGCRISRWIPDFSGHPVWADGVAFMELETSAGERIPVVVSSPVACQRSGRAVGRAHVIRDRREVLSLQRQLVVSARLAAVGDLSKSISHSIQQPVERTRDELDALSVDWQALHQALEATHVHRECREAVQEGLELIEECVEGTDRICSIVDEVGSFSSGRAGEAMTPHSLVEIVQQAVRIARAQAPDHVEIVSRIGDDVRILCHRPRIERVVTNLLVNAIQALEESQAGRAHLVVEVEARGDRALLRVEDDGCGIQPEVLDRIFDPFFTTKPVGKGTGLGLAISYQIVRDHGGEIRVTSNAGRGTSVTVELPRSMESG